MDRRYSLRILLSYSDHSMVYLEVVSIVICILFTRILHFQLEESSLRASSQFEDIARNHARVVLERRRLLVALWLAARSHVHSWLTSLSPRNGELSLWLGEKSNPLSRYPLHHNLSNLGFSAFILSTVF